MHQVRTQGSNDSIEGPKIRGSGARSIQNQQLMFEQQRLGNDGTSTTRQQEFGDGRNEMNKQNHPLSHARHRSRRSQRGKTWTTCTILMQDL
jgi:hypothetical protein